MNLDTYERVKRANYAALAEAVASVLFAAIRAQSGIRLQHVQHRAKMPESLKRKLENAGALTSDAIETYAKDLAGCRLVFYTNSDVSRFLSSGLVSENFEIDWDRTKIHHPDPASTDARDLFISNNYVVRFKEPRASLAEYAPFKDLWCEVQVQTTLNHAWSEMAHDTMYKTPALRGFGASLMKGIEQRMEKIMRNFLLPAGYEFQKVLHDFERLSSGKDLFDRNALQALLDAKDNNERYDALEKFSAHVLPHYDDLQAVHQEIRLAVVSAIKQARITPTNPIDTPFEPLRGRTSEDIVELGADVLDQLRYVGVDAVEATFDALCQLFREAESEKERHRLLASARNLAKHEMHVWNKAGPIVQQVVIQRIRQLDGTIDPLCRPIIVAMLEEILEPEIEGTTSTHDAITIRTGAVSPSEDVIGIRSKAIDLLKTLFRSASDDAEKLIIVSALSNATRPPRSGLSNVALKKMILEGINAIVRFYGEVATTLSFELTQRLEHDLLWLYRNYGRAPTNEPDDASTSEMRKRMVDAIFSFRDLVNLNHAFVVYKTLVGYESVFPPAWEEEEFEIERETSYREQLILELAKEVSDENADHWFATIKRCAHTVSNDMATFPNFAKFLEHLGRERPAVALRYLDRMEDPLSRFLPGMLHGLDDGEGRDAAHRKINEWIEQKRYIGQIVWYQRFSKKCDVGMLASALRTAIATSDEHAASSVVGTCAARYAEYPQLREKIALPAIEFLTSKDNTSWVHAIWPRSKCGSLFSGLTSDQADFIFSCLVRHPKIDHRVEEVICEIAKSWPTKVIDFFGARLATKREDSDIDKDKNYEAIPYKLYKLNAGLQAQAAYIVEKSKAWFEDDDQLFVFRGGRFLFAVFRKFTEELEASLMRLVETTDKRNIEFVAEILQNYKGNPSTHGLYKAIVEAVPVDDSILTSVAVGLESTGVVSGQFGFVEAYKRKKEEVTPWLDDEREKVRTFAKSYIAGLDRMIAAEQRRGEEDLEMRKRNFEPATDDDELDT